LEGYQQALAITREVGDRTREATILGNLGQTYYDIGQYKQALENLQESLPILQELGDRAGEPATLRLMGVAYNNLSQYEHALDAFQKSLTIEQQLGNQVEEAATLHGIGQTYDGLGQYEQALDYFQKALLILEEIDELKGQARALASIATIHSYLDQSEQALVYLERALTIQQAIGDQEGEAGTLNNIGLAYEALDKNEQALDYYQRALIILQEIGDRRGEAPALLNIGVVYDNLAQDNLAAEYYQQALAIYRELGDQAGEAELLANLGYVSEQQGLYDQAISYSQQAVEVVEAIQGEIRVEELKTSFVSEYAEAYEFLIGLLWNEHRFEEAFNYAERARARAFLDGLANGTLDFRAGVDADLLAREQALSSEIVALRTELVNLRSHPSAELDTDAIAVAQEELAEREAEYARLLTDIKLQSPEVAGLVSVDVATLAEIQGLLDSNTTLVEYFVTEDRTLAFLITKDSLETVEVSVLREDLSKAINDFRDFASLQDLHPASLEQLYVWLVAPLKDKLTTSMLGIIPHGVLHYLPFAALTNGAHYLSEEYTVFALPSASALRFIQAKHDPAANTILALGNPTITEPGMAPLKFAQQEVETIADMFGAQPLVGDSATESNLRSQAPGASILHLAAHGQYNPDNPLFSTIFLTGDQQEDGRFEVHEIYNLDLTQVTELVVLSACETQVGAVSAGDEVVGLTRAFLYAGTPTVIASLWNVDDEATTLLMERFYTHLRDGMSKAQALQAAQSDVRAQYPHPYYWSAFTLTGDAQSTILAAPAVLPTVDDGMWRVAGFGGAFVLGTCCLAFIVILATGLVWRARQKRAIK
jgi:CHAT domain-containing protein/Tfp pilus assembly protein PilF